MVQRSLIFNVIFYSSIVFFGITCLPALCSRKLTRLVVVCWSRMIILSLQKIIRTKICYENRHILKKKGYLIAANHQSAFDTIFFFKEFDKVIYIVKKELKYIPIYGWYAMRLGNIFLNRKERIKSVKKLSSDVSEFLKKGYKVIIFPEGTRQVDKIGRIKPGIFAIQKACKCKVYPIFINSGKVWPKNTLLKYNKVIKVKTLPYINYSINKNDFLEKLETSFKKEYYENT